jgi:hypothetical protein
MNGAVPFVHPVTGKRVGAFEFYDGYAHQPTENTEYTNIVADGVKEDITPNEPTES